MQKYLTIGVILTALFFNSCNDKNADLPVVQNVDLDKYLGSWYEIARLPNSFEKGLICCSANYTLNDDGSIKVINKGRKESDPSNEKTATGKAWIPDSKQPGKLKVSFFWIFSADYWIIDLDEDYKWAVVGHPNRKYFWILAREKSLPDSTVKQIYAKAETLGFNLSKIITVKQDCE